MTVSILVLALLTAALGDGGAQESTVLASYDLRAVLPRWDDGTSWSQSLNHLPGVGPEQETSEAGGNYSDMAAFEVLDLLTQVMGDELRREGREMLVDGSALTVLAPEPVQEQVRAVLDALRQALAGTIAVRVDVLALGDGSSVDLVPSSVLADDEAAKLVASLIGRGAQQRSFQLELSAGRTAWVDARRRVPFVFDYDVEIAQGSVVFAPFVPELRDGVRMGLRGLPVNGGLALSSVLMINDLLGKISERKLLLRGQLNRIPPNQAEVVSSELVKGPGAVQMPQTLVRALAFDTFVPDGKALVLSLETDLGPARTREVVILRRLGGSMTSYVARPIPRTNRTLIALNVELFRTPSLVSSLVTEHDDYDHPQAQVVANFDAEAPSFLVEWVKVRFSVWRRFGPWILIVTDPAWDREAASDLERLIQSRRGNVRLVQAGVDLRAQGRETPFPVRARLPVVAGTSVGLVVGRAFTYLGAYQVEVAQGASVPDPVMQCMFEGLAMTWAVDPTTCEAAGIAQLLDAPPATFDPAYDLMGPLDRPEPRVLSFDERLNLPEGPTARARIGMASDRPEQQGLTVELSVGSR